MPKSSVIKPQNQFNILSAPS